MPFDMRSPHWGSGGGSGRPYSSDDMASVLFFLRQCEIEGEMWQAITGTQAFEAACRVMQLPPDAVRQHLDLE